MTPSTEDPSRSYTTEEVARVTNNLLLLTEAVHAGRFSSVPVSVELLRALHLNLFRSVRGHAGRCSGVGRGTERLVFGPHRSPHRDEVDGLLSGIFQRAQVELATLQGSSGASDWEVRTIEFAIRLHADIIRVHPFEDGNGRTCRAFMNAVLVRLGLRAILLEAPKQEYLACLNHYYHEDDLGPLLNLALDLYVGGM